MLLFTDFQLGPNGRNKGPNAVLGFQKGGMGLRQSVSERRSNERRSERRSHFHER